MDQRRIERFWRRVQVGAPDDCWPITGYIGKGGYGSAQMDGRRTTAHRAAYVLTNGPVDDTLEIDHLCKNRRCCNPRHLEAVTSRVNMLRSGAPSARYAVARACVHGHPFTPDNTYIRPNGHRTCRQCNREYVRLYKAQHAEDVRKKDSAHKRALRARRNGDQP